MFKENEKPLLTGSCLLRGIREPEVLFVAAEFEPAIQRIINDKPVPQLHRLRATRLVHKQVRAQKRPQRMEKIDTSSELS
jgi:hypothetical protein